MTALLELLEQSTQASQQSASLRVGRRAGVRRWVGACLRVRTPDASRRAAADGAGHGGDVEPQPLLIDKPAVWAALRPASENDLATSLSGSRLGLSRPNSPLMAGYLGDLQVHTC